MPSVSRRHFVKTAAAASLAGSPSARALASTGNQTFDFVIAGAGHNSLITAAYLARAGFSVVVLEGRPTIGGGCKSGEICLPGFVDDWCSSVHSILMSNPLIRNNELNLFDYGLEYIHPDPIMHMPHRDGASITMWADIDRTYEQYAQHSKRDAETFLRLIEDVQDLRRHSAAGEPLPSLWRKRYAMSAYDVVRELFEDDYIRSFHLATGKFTSEPGGDPDTGRTAYTAIFHQLGGRPIPKGGSGMLTTALGSAIEARGGVILTNKPVTRLVTEQGKCRGVECADGDRFTATHGVVSTIHVKHLVEMAPKDLWGDEFVAHIDLFQPEEALFALHLATSAPLEYPLSDGGSITPSESTVLPYPERILRSSYDDATGTLNLEDMWLQIVSPSIADPGRTPDGFHTIKILGNVPYALKEGVEHWDSIRDEVADAVLAYLREYAPSFSADKVLARLFMSPRDLERMNPAFWRGSIHAGEYGPSQMGDLRPAPGWSDYRMPIDGLYQTGACTRPGGSITGRPGRNAASVILAEHGIRLDDIVHRA